MSATLTAVANPRLVQALLQGDASRVKATLAGSTLLVPAAENRDGETVIQIRRGPSGRRLVCAFTDLEALGAWDRNPPDHAVALDASAVADLVGDGIVALNPAGPGALALDGPTLAASAGRDDATAQNDTASSLTNPEQRVPLRRQAKQFHQLARRAAQAGDLEGACAQIQPAIAACEELGDRLHEAAASLELASWRARTGSTRLAMTGWREAAATMAALGELDLALDALLDAAQVATRAGFAADAEALSVTALELAAGSDFSDRLIGVWRSLP
jgi:SseB protein N-terminal domain